MLTIGLCGGIGTGKTTAQDAFRAFGIPGIDADVVYHSLIEHPSPLTTALAKRFGQKILRQNGSVDRAALAAIVFSEGNERDREDLNRLTHGAVLDECRAWLAEKEAEGADAAIVNAPLLFESGFDRECNLTIAILAPTEVRVERILSRDGMSRAEALRRIEAQHSDEYLTEHTDFQLVNDRDLQDLTRKVHDLAEIIRKNAEEYKHGKQEFI